MPATAAGVRELVSDAADRLAEAGCETPRLDAELLLAEALGVAREWLFVNPNAAVPERAAARCSQLIDRRARREPVAYIVGKRWFRELELRVDRRVLIPRPETELLVELALELAPGARVHDVGTGSGAVALALKAERGDLEVSGSDVSAAAVEVARANARRLELDVPFTQATGAPAGDHDLVVANLPYVREDEWPALAPEINQYEPRGALVGGPDGLDVIAAVVDSIAPGTRIALEHAPAQSEAVRAMLDRAVTHRDLAGRERVTSGAVPPTGRGRRERSPGGGEVARAGRVRREHPNGGA